MSRTGLAKVMTVGMMADCIKLGVVGITSTGRAHGHSNWLNHGDLSVGEFCDKSYKHKWVKVDSIR